MGNNPISYNDPIGNDTLPSGKYIWDDGAIDELRELALYHPGSTWKPNFWERLYLIGENVGFFALPEGGLAKTAETTNNTVKDIKATERGVQNEEKVLKDMKLPKNNKTYEVIDPVTKKPVKIKPDSNEKLVVEIKDTKRVSNTKQIRGERELAKQQGKPFRIVTGKKTKVSNNIPANEVIRRKDIGPK